MNDWLGELGLRGTTLIGGLAGALVSLKFVPGVNLWQRSTNVIGGMLAAAYVAPLAANFLTLPDKVLAGIAFLIGLYGMQVASAFVEEIPRWLQGIREKYTNRGDRL